MRLDFIFLPFISSLFQIVTRGKADENEIFFFFFSFFPTKEITQAFLE
jgi:hypothetical protein